MDRFFSKIRKIARVALADHPQLLEKMGIKVSSSPPKRKKKTT
jgi:hypothetical protein